jgi:hypothetical protein
MQQRLFGGRDGCSAAGNRSRRGAINAKSFIIDGEAVVLGPDGLSRFDELRRREAGRTAILYAFDLIEHDGEDLRDLPFHRKAALVRLLRDTEAGILLNEHFVGDGATVFEHACRLGAEGIVSKRVDGIYRSGHARRGSRFAILPASRRSGSAARGGIGEPDIDRGRGWIKRNRPESRASDGHCVKTRSCNKARGLSDHGG